MTKRELPPEFDHFKKTPPPEKEVPAADQESKSREFGQKKNGGWDALSENARDYLTKEVETRLRAEGKSEEEIIEWRESVAEMIQNWGETFRRDSQPTSARIVKEEKSVKPEVALAEISPANLEEIASKWDLRDPQQATLRIKNIKEKNPREIEKPASFFDKKQPAEWEERLAERKKEEELKGELKKSLKKLHGAVETRRSRNKDLKGEPLNRAIRALAEELMAKESIKDVLVNWFGRELGTEPKTIFFELIKDSWEHDEETSAYLVRISQEKSLWLHRRLEELIEQQMSK